MTHSAKWFIEIGGELLGGIGTHTNAGLQEFVQDDDLEQGRDIAYVQIAYGLSPEPLTPEAFGQRVPYTNLEVVKTQLKEAAERGWLNPLGADQYTVSARGKETVDRFFDHADGLFGGIESLPERELQRMVELLTKVVPVPETSLNRSSNHH